MNNLYLIQPNFKQPYFASSDDKYVDGCYFLPYSIATLWSYVKTVEKIERNYSLNGMLFKREPFSKVIGMLDKPNVIGFSNYTWCWEYNVWLARRIKEIYPNTLIVFGGPSVPDNMEGFFEKHPYVDITVHGEGEHTFRDILLENLKPEPDFRSVDGISLNDHGDYIKTPPRERLKSLDELPNPYVCGLLDDLARENPFVRWSATIETNRGCPYKCTFCEWGGVNYTKVRKFDNSVIKKALDWCSRHEVEFVHCADANFGIFKEKDEEIVDYLIELREKTGYPKVFDVTWAKFATPLLFSMIRKLSRGGLYRGLTLSVQSMSPKVLEAINRINMKSSNLKEMLKLCEQSQLPSYTELILGLPEETLESWKNGICEIIDLGQHNSLDVNLCHLLSNSEMNYPEVKEKYKLKTVSTRRYLADTENDEDVGETADLIISTSSMPYDDFIKAFMFSWCVVNLHHYGWTQIVSRFLRKNDDMTYRSFYDRLYDWIEEGKAPFLHENFVMIHEDITTFLQGSGSDETKVYSAGGKSILLETQKQLHLNQAVVRGELKNFFESLEVSDSELFSETLRFQDAYVTDSGRTYPVEHRFTFNILDFINDAEPLRREQADYKFDLIEDYIDQQDYIGKLYFRRNVGWGKAKIHHLD